MAKTVTAAGPDHSDEANAACAWTRIVAAYREPNHARSFFELAVTIGPLILLWGAMWWSLSLSYWLCLVLAVPAAGFLVRLFMIQHDCGHGAFFRQRQLNDWLGRLLGVLTLTPYHFWKRTHGIHHASFGNLDRRGVGDITTLTLREYLALPARRRFAYRLYRHPAVMFGIGPAYLFFLQHRMPVGLMRSGKSWISTMGTNAALAVFAAAMMWLVGAGPFLLVHLPITLLGASMGVWLFYVQHQFEEVRWTDGRSWTLSEAALHGSSYYDLPAILRWFTADIGVHHVHHLCSRIPFYRLRQVLREHPQLTTFGRVTILQSLKTVRLALWDERRERLISFREALASAP
jgi:omega-6 fatty acid desaturase (delta-12 desaturase)